MKRREGSFCVACRSMVDAGDGKGSYDDHLSGKHLRCRDARAPRDLVTGELASCRSMRDAADRCGNAGAWFRPRCVGEPTERVSGGA